MSRLLARRTIVPVGVGGRAARTRSYTTDVLRCVFCDAMRCDVSFAMRCAYCVAIQEWGQRRIVVTRWMQLDRFLRCFTFSLCLAVAIVTEHAAQRNIIYTDGEILPPPTRSVLCCGFFVSLHFRTSHNHTRCDIWYPTSPKNTHTEPRNST